MIMNNRRNPLEEIKEGALEAGIQKYVVQKTGKKEAVRGMGFFN